MARRKRQRRSKRRGNPAYSEKVFGMVNEFIDALDKAVNVGYKVEKKIDITAGQTKVGAMILRISDAMRDHAEALEDELGS